MRLLSVVRDVYKVGRSIILSLPLGKLCSVIHSLRSFRRNFAPLCLLHVQLMAAHKMARALYTPSRPQRKTRNNNVAKQIITFFSFHPAP